MNSILIVFRLLEVTECCGSAVLWTSACPAGDLDADECPGSVGVRPLCAAGYASRSISWLLTLRQQDCSCWNTLGQITLPQEWWLLSSGNLIVTVRLKLLVRHKVLYQVLYVGQEFSWCSQLSPPISPGVPGRQEQRWWNQEAAQLCPGSSAREVKALLVLLSTRIGVAQLTSFSITIELQKQYDATRMPQQRWTSSHNMAAARSVTLCHHGVVFYSQFPHYRVSKLALLIFVKETFSWLTEWCH